MRLTAYTDYSVRVLMYLALVPDRRVTIDEVSDAYGISANHVMKITHRLGRLGYVETIRGRSGGLRLAGSPEEIKLGELVRHMEGDLALVECMQPEHRESCRITPACHLAVVFAKAANAFLGILDQHTLADIVRNSTRLKALLGTESAPYARPPGASAKCPPRGRTRKRP